MPLDVPCQVAELVRVIRTMPGGDRLPVVPLVAVNRTWVREDASLQLGDEVVLFGDPERGEPSVEDWAVAAGTISYEIITRIGPRVHREFINNSW